MIGNLVVVEDEIFFLKKSFKTYADANPVRNEMDLHPPFYNLMLAFEHFIDCGLNQSQ
jgi:hypothetical protein